MSYGATPSAPPANGGTVNGSWIPLPVPPELAQQLTDQAAASAEVRACPPLAGANAVAVIASGFPLWISAGTAALLGGFAGTTTVCATALGWFRACWNCWEA